MKNALPKVQGTCCFSSSFNGEIIDSQASCFFVRTEIGPIKLHVNSFTNVCCLRKPYRLGSPLFRKLKILNLHEVIGQAAIGTLVAYAQPDTQQDDGFLCTRLALLGNSNDGPSYMESDFWLSFLVETANWWLEHAMDLKEGGYYTNIEEQGRPAAGLHGHDKWSYVISRTLYGFSTAFALTGRKEFLDAARHGLDFLLDRAVFTRNDYRLFRTRMDRCGRRHPDEPGMINIFTQLYGLTGLAAYYDITRCKKTALTINEILRSLAELYRDDRHGGFYDAISQSDLRPISGVTDSKSFNSIVDPLSATFYFLRNANFKTEHLNLEEMTNELCALICQHFVCHRQNFIREVFSRSWRYRKPSWRNPYNTPFGAGSVGDCMKVIWVLLRAIDGLPGDTRKDATKAIRSLQDSMFRCGAWDALRGGWFEWMDGTSPRGSLAEHTDHTNKVWWHQEEGILACILSHVCSGQAKELKMATDAMAFWITCFHDHANGGFFDTVSMDGMPVKTTKGYWLKGGYHEIELARFVHIYLRVLNHQPVNLFYEWESSRPLADYESIPARIPYLSWHVKNKRKCNNDIVKVCYDHGWKDGRV